MCVTRWLPAGIAAVTGRVSFHGNRYFVGQRAIWHGVQPGALLPEDLPNQRTGWGGSCPINSILSRLIFVILHEFPLLGIFEYSTILNRYSLKNQATFKKGESCSNVRFSPFLYLV